MPGRGIKVNVTFSKMIGARLLDLSRSLRRVGRTPTGVDRVERAYLSGLMRGDVPLFGLFRTPLGYILLDQEGLEQFQARLLGAVPWGDADRLSKFVGRRDLIVQRAESDVRRFSVARALPMRLSQVLTSQLCSPFQYYNVGHSNLTKRVFNAIASASGQTHVMVHDVIPLSHPQFQRSAAVAQFERKLQLTSRFADRVIYNSSETRDQAKRFFSDFGRIPPGIVAPLGIDVDVAPDADLPPELKFDEPYFLTVGTIEPRKNHAFLLDLWDMMGSEAPKLLICGSRGWKNEGVFDRLDQLTVHDRVTEVSGLDDAKLLALMKNAQALLFPSLVEGYGLPVVESLAVGSRVLCNDLSVLREVSRSSAQLVAVSDSQRWINIIQRWKMLPPSAPDAVNFKCPTWQDHLNIVLNQGR
ncbi:MAG: glycosyltransferase family 1 protein [Pseudomonadota bacterium]